MNARCLICVMSLVPVLLPCASVRGQEEATTSPVVPAAEHPVLVDLKTSLGTIALELNPDKAPLTVLNFVDYVRDGFYSGTIFHRVEADNLIQGGGYGPSLERKTEGVREPVPIESNNGLANMRGTIAMVRGNLPETATTQFFINVADNAGHLDFGNGWGYTVFGRVVDGLDVVDKIASAEVRSHPKYAAGKLAVVPATPVVIESASMRNPDDRRVVVEAADRKKEQIRKARELAQKTEAQWLDEFVKEIEGKYGLKFETDHNGISTLDIRVGKGPEPFEDGEVNFQYTGTLVKGRRVFESNVGVGEPPWYKLDELISGLRIALSGMSVGGKRIAIIPPDYAFGAEGVPRGNPPLIPPNAMLIYEIDLLNIKAPGSP